MSALITKLEELSKRFDEINSQMNDPAVASDGQKIVALSKEHASLGKIVEPYRTYKKLANDYEEAQAIINDPDGDPRSQGACRNGGRRS